MKIRFFLYVTELLDKEIQVGKINISVYNSAEINSK